VYGPLEADLELAGGEGVVFFGVAPEIAPKLTGLNIEHPAIGHFVAELGVLHLSVETAEPSTPELATTGVAEEDAF
ncbi:hypothetical protein N9Z22_01285, partial [bacterium]|nr:hypothetical protein [bacterium]